MLILCGVFFLLPFILRGAREAVDGIKNDVADWLPKSFQETTELNYFREHFVGDQFVVVSWEGCTDRDPAYKWFYDKVKEESLAGEKLDLERLALMDKASQEYADLKEEIEARQWATELGLQTTGTYYENWGLYKEKWLQGKNKQWYFVRQDGSVFRWSGQNNLIDGASRFFKRFLNGQNEAIGTFVKRFGEEKNNRFYNSPELLCARFFVDIITGPDIFERMAGPDGTMKVGNYKSDDLASFQAEVETHKRLTGVLFGPTPTPDFNWTYESLLTVVPQDTSSLLDENSKPVFEAFVSGLVAQTFAGDIEKLRTAPQSTQLEHWYYLWRKMEIPAPPRQTCFVVTLNDPVLDELARVVGRPVLGKPRGRILEIASGSCGIEPNHLHIGGPPVDNVAIDEEGSITLFRLVGLSAVIGMGLAWICFRSIPLTLMVFFVGGVSAIMSLAIVWYAGTTMDAILMTMPSLIYVMGLSGAVHVVNYYREAVAEHGEEHAADIAAKNGLWPSFLCASTTAIGLASLCTSDLTPINKFGTYSAIAVMATFVLLFTYLPASLTIWPTTKKRARRDVEHSNENKAVVAWNSEKSIWDGYCKFIIRHHRLVIVATIIFMICTSLGVGKIQTSVQLLKLFRNDARILDDYRWMESKLGKLVPMEVLLHVDGDLSLRPHELPAPEQITNEQYLAIDLKLDLLQRIELSDRVRRYILQVYGDESPDPERRVIGNVMSTDLTTPLKWAVDSQEFGARSRISTNSELEFKRDALHDQDFLRVDKSTNEELWRISLRLAALNDLDYGQFISEIKTVVEPVLAAYRYRMIVLKEMHKIYNNREQGKLLVIGRAPFRKRNPDDPEPHIGLAADGEVDQTALFVNTFRDLLENSAFIRKGNLRRLTWLDPEQLKDNPLSEDKWKQLDEYDCVVVVGEHPLVDQERVKKYAKSLIVASDYKYIIDKESKEAMSGMMTANERKAEGDENSLVKATYTGIVPIVYKAQRALLQSLIQSMISSFVSISLIMMVLLRPWGRRLTFGNALSFRAGFYSMLPNVFPIIVVFGIMGHAGILVDIGSMMTASVALGIAVDDTIHFLTWFRRGIADGLERNDAILYGFRRVGTSMVQTSLIAGLGLSAFAFSTFMPTQRFGMLMLVLLFTAVAGDLICLPAILSSRLGKAFCNVVPTKKIDDSPDEIGGSAATQALSSAVNGDSTSDRPATTGNQVEAPHMLQFQKRLSDQQ